MAPVTISAFEEEQLESGQTSAELCLVTPAVPLRKQVQLGYERVKRGAGSSSTLLDFKLCSRIDCLVAAPLFHGLSLAEYAEMASAARERRFESKNAIFREGEGVEFIYLITRGWTKTTQLSRSGKQVILRVDGRGDVIDGICPAPNTLHGLTTEAIDGCHVLTWDTKVFSAFVKRFPVIQSNANKILADRLRKLEERFRDLATEPVAQRLARLLVALYEQSRGAAQDLKIALSCEELSQMTGTTLFTVCRLLCGWEKDGLIYREQKAIRIDKISVLMAVAEGL